MKIIRQRHEKREEKWHEWEEALTEEVQHLKRELERKAPEEPMPIEDHADETPPVETPEERMGATTEHLESSAVSYSAGMQQIPDLPTFTGETAEDSETIGDWLDQI